MVDKEYGKEAVICSFVLFVLILAFNSVMKIIICALSFSFLELFREP